MHNSWSMEDFSAEKIQENMKNKIFTVPTYQRGIVWKESQKKDLVDTIKRGLPFGTLLIFKESNEDYLIIDGLQRSNALVEFVSNPTQFFDSDDIDDTALENIVSMVGDMNGNVSSQIAKVRSLLEMWVKKNHKTMKEVEAMQYASFCKVLYDEFPKSKGKELEIAELIEPMMKNFKEICKNINDTKVPAIVMQGDPAELPIIFERINSKGLVLSKYDIYAASWKQAKYKLNSDLNDLVLYNRNRYEHMLDGNSKLENYDSLDFVNDKELTAFEIAFGFGKKLCKDYPHLFGVSKEDKTVESIGFTIINTCLGMKNKDTAKMGDILLQRIGRTHINQFLLKILDCVHLTDIKVGKYSKFKSNSRTNAGAKPLHTEFQIASIVCSIFIMKYTTIIRGNNDEVEQIEYDFSKVNKEWYTIYETPFKENVAKIYIKEVLQHRWSGTGDKKLDMVLVTPDYYTKPVSQEDFASTLDIWNQSLNNERSEYKQVASPKEPELLIIAVLYLDMFDAQQQIDDTNYDIEHLATKKLMKKHLAKYNNNNQKELRLPISSMGNLCLLPEYTNRSKGDKTIYQDTKYLDKSHLTISEIEKKYTLTERKDLEWLDDYNWNRDEFKEKYENFIKYRYEIMKQKILANYKNI
ncbi:MAG: DUF262 domain-containing protein [Thomasclavelia sp.]|jgi:hypothetical protein|nr:DUF262 domain-containing protein [Thomasclavelia sp.]